MSAVRCEIGEGPVWHDRALWWVDINSGLLLRLDAENGSITGRATGDFLGTAVPTTSTDLWLLARGDHLALLNWRSGAIKPLAQSSHGINEQRFNDGKCDPAGRFFVGTLDLRNAGRACSLYVYAPGGPLSVVDNDILLSNGIAWTHGGRRLHHVDTLRRTISTRDYEPSSGSISGITGRVHLPDSWGLPDGMAADQENGLWVAFWGGGCIRRIDPENMHETHWIPLPASNASSVCFGGDNLDRLMITTARHGLDTSMLASQPLAGSLFVAELPFRGVPNAPFNLSIL